MIFSSNHTNQILRKTGDGKRMTLETIESIQTLVERKELRVKKFDFDSKVQTDDFHEQAKEIKNLIDQHERIDSKIIDHYKKECSQQEDQFQRKMKERKDRSVERSMSKSIDAGGSRRNMNRKVFGEGQTPPAPRDLLGSRVEAKAPVDAVPRSQTMGALLESQPSGEAGPKENDPSKDALLAGAQDAQMDAFSYKKLSALSAKLNKMKMFNQEFENKADAEDSSAPAPKPLREVEVNKKQV